MSNLLDCNLYLEQLGNWPNSPGASAGQRLTKDAISEVSLETKLLWARGIGRIMSTGEDSPSIRPWNLTLHLDGSVDHLEEKTIGRVTEMCTYPVRFRIPQNLLEKCGRLEMARRAELFALGTFLYMVMSGHVPFEDLTDEEVQLRYIAGQYPNDTDSLLLSAAICSCWKQDIEISEVFRP